MRAPTMESLLAAWDVARGQAPVKRALTLLQAAHSESARETLLELSVCERDHRLIDLRESVFGNLAIALATCPDCAETLELSLRLSDLQMPNASGWSRAGELSAEGYHVRFHLPNSSDLIRISAEREVGRAARLLLESCVDSATCDGMEIGATKIPQAIAERVVQQMEDLDSQGDLRIAITCPSCSTSWNAVFDIASFFWTELDRWVTRILRQVHALASAYGWHEQDILAMHPSRRDFYLEMLGT